LRTSRSENSISSIGEFSPSSSSDQTNDSPQDHITTESPLRLLPQSHAINSISNLVTSQELSPETSQEELSMVPSTKDGSPHPAIARIYDPFFAEIDNMLQHLDLLLPQS